MAQWYEITRSDKYQSLDNEQKAELKKYFFEKRILPQLHGDPEFSGNDKALNFAFQDFMATPDDTGQGYVTSMLGAAGRGFGEMVPGAIEGVGALTGSEGLREFGQDVRGGLESISPVNPIYGESIPVKLAGVGGQVGSMLATAGAGGLAGKALGGVGAATTGMRAAPLASAFLQGSAEGAREAEQYGMTGPEAYLRTLAGGAIEAGTEFLPFGMTAETALAKRILTGAPRTGTFLGAVGSEAGEEGLGQIASNIATKTLAPAGVETPDIIAGALEAAAYGAAGGAMLGGVNALISTPTERQTQIQKDLQAEAGAIPKDTVPDQTNEEKMAAMEKGGVTVVSPDGKTAVIVPEPSMPDPTEVAKTIGDASVEQLAATGNEASAAAQADFNAILAERLGETPESTIQPEQAAEEAGAEVTPLSEGAERNRAVIAEAAAKLRGEAPQDISAGVKAAIPQQPVEAQEDAAPEIPLEESLRQEPQDRVESREAEETGAGDQLRSPAEGEEEVAQPPAAVVSTEAPQPSPNLPALIAVRDNNATPEQVQSLVAQGLVEQVDGQNIITEAGVAAMPKDQRPKLTPAERTAEVKGMAAPVAEPSVTTPAKAATVKSTELRVGDEVSFKGNTYRVKKILSDGRVRAEFTNPEGIARIPKGSENITTLPRNVNFTRIEKQTPVTAPVERDATKPAQMTPEEFEKVKNSLNVKRIIAQSKLADAEAIQPSKNPAVQIKQIAKQRARRQELDDAERAFEEFYPTMASAVEDAIKNRQPFSTAAHKEIGMDYIPSGYVKQGDLYVFQPEAPAGPLRISIPEGATSSRTDNVKYQVAGLPDEVVDPFLAHGTDSADAVEALVKSGPRKDTEHYEGRLVPKDDGSPWGNTKTSASFVIISKPGQTTSSPNEIGAVVVNRTSRGDEKTASMIAGMERRLDGTGVAVLTPEELPNWLRRTVSQTTAAEKQTPVPLREGTGAAGVVQSEPVEGSIPTDEKVSPETESESSEKLDTVAQIDRLVQSGAKPEEMDKFVKSLTDEQFNELVASEAFDVDPKLVIKPKDTYDSKRIKRRKFVDAVNASTKEVRKTAQQVFQEEEAAAKKQQAGEEMRSKAIDSIIGASEKKKRKFGQVTNSDAIAAVAMLVSSKDVPGVLTTWTGTKEDFLRDPANQTADPEIYARIKAGELVEGFFNKGRAYVFLDGIGVSDEDMLRGEQMSVTPQVAAVRRVLLHESLVHRGIHGLPLRHRRLILNWVRQNSTPAELDDLAKLYTEYANWRNSDYDFEALAEELLAKKVDSLTEIPKDGPMAKLMDILRQIWDFIVGYKREPTLSDLKSVVKLLKSGAEALANDRLKDGGEVKLSIRAFHGTPHKVDKFTTAKIGTGEGAQAYGWGLYFAQNKGVAKSYQEALSGGNRLLINGKTLEDATVNLTPTQIKWAQEVDHYVDEMQEPLERAKGYVREGIEDALERKSFERFASTFGVSDSSGNLYTVELLPDESEFLDWDKPLSEQSEKVKAALKAVQAKPVTADGLDMGGGSVIRDNRRGQFDKSKPYPWLLVSGKSAFGLSQADVDRMTKAQTDATGENIYTRLTASEGSQKAASEYLASLGIPGIRYLDGGSRPANVMDARLLQVFEQNNYDVEKTVAQMMRSVYNTPKQKEAIAQSYREQLERGKPTRNYVIFDENLVRILEENGQSLTPPEGSDIRFSRPQFSSETSAALSAGSEAARSTLYSERDMDVREAIRRAYEAMPKTNSVAVPIGELFAKTEELMPGVTQEEFSLVLQDLFEDNGAVLQEGDVVETLTEKDAEYMAAVEAGDMEKAQRMVDEAAMATGYVSAVKHGTHNDFSIFDTSKGRNQWNRFEMNNWGIWTTEDDASIYGPKVLKLYGKSSYPLRVQNFEDWFDDYVKHAYPLFYFKGITADELAEDLKSEAGAYFKRKKDIPLGIVGTNEYRQMLADQPGAKGYAKSLKDRGFDSVLIEGGFLDGQLQTVRIYLDSNQLKSADPVTRDDQGRIIPLSRRFDTGADIRGQINVTTPEGKRAGFVVVMPRAAKASRIKAEGPAVSKLQEDVRNIDEGSVKADFEGVQFKDTKPNQRTVKPKQSYTDAAVEFVDSLQNEGNSLEDIAYSIQSPEFIEGLGIERDLSMQDAIGLEVRNRINNALRKEKAPSVKARLNKLNLSLSKFWQGIGSVKGQHLAIRQKLIADPRYRWMFIKDKAESAMKDARENVATANITSTDDLTNQMNREGEKASEQAGQSVADDAESVVEENEDAALIREGEETLDEKSKSLWGRAKMLIMRLAMYARADKADIKTGSKASLSKEQRDELNAILRMPKAERDKARAKDEAELKVVLKTLLGEEVDAKTPEQKKIRGKRIKGIQTLEKRVKKGKPVDVEIEGETESSEEQVSKAEKTAQSILKGLSERYSDPLIFNEKRPNVDAMRELYKERVKQGVGPNQMTEKSFISKAVELGANEATAGILWKAAELEIDAREAMRQDKILQRRKEIGARADAQAHRIIFAKERLKRQSGFSGIESNANKDTIIKAFQEQVKTPISQDAFIARLRPLNVSETVAKRLFTAAEREKADLEAMEAFRMLEGPDALKNILREIEGMRRGEEIPLRTPIPWRQLLSQKAKTVEEYRQRIFDAISSNEAFQNLSDDKKAKLADLFSEAWESKRKDILERMLTNLINKEEAAKRISQKGAQALREQSQRLVEDINLGILDSDELMKRLAEKFGIKSEFTEEEKQKIDSLIDTLQDSTLNRVKRNKAAYDLLKTLSGTVKVPITKLLADLWVTNVLSGINTMTSIALAVSSGAFELTSGVLRIIKAAIANQKQLPSEISASFKSLARFLGAFPREANLAWQYLVTGDRAFLDPSMNDVLNDLNYDSIGKSVSLAERLAESDKLLKKTVGVWMRTVSRLLTALDSFNSGVTKSGAIPIVARQLELDPATLAKVEESMNLQNYKDRIIQRDFAGVAPKTAREKALVDSWAKDEMMADLDKYGEFTENADFFGQQGAMTLEPSGIGGMIYRLIKSVTGNLSAGSDRFLAESQRKWQERGKSDSMDATRLALAYALQFIAYNSANLAGLRFARFAGNKFNQGLSFIPGIGMLRLFEADLDKTHVKGKDAFMDMIQRNQFAGVMMSMVGLAILKAIADEPDDEKRGWAFNGGWANLTPERKQQKLAAGEKEYTIRVGDKVFNYQNWPISSVLAAIGGLSDLIRYSPEQWNEKSIAGRLGSAAASGVFAASEIPALSQFQELFGSNLSSKDPNEKKLDRFSRVMAGWGGGFVPRILKDFDFLAEPTLKKYDTLWERTASHIPVYRRYVGDDYYDILGKPIERKIYPGSREFMEKPSAPEYQILGKLNSRGIWLTPANAEHRMVGKGRNRRRLTQEEADAYSLETGKGYRQMLLRYGQRALQMPTERARAFLSDKADEVRDRALKKVYRR